MFDFASRRGIRASRLAAIGALHDIAQSGRFFEMSVRTRSRNSHHIIGRLDREKFPDLGGVLKLRCNAVSGHYPDLAHGVNDGRRVGS